jgi:hypothetical protein
MMGGGQRVGGPGDRPPRVAAGGEAGVEAVDLRLRQGVEQPAGVQRGEEGVGVRERGLVALRRASQRLEDGIEGARTYHAVGRDVEALLLQAQLHIPHQRVEFGHLGSPSIDLG